MSTFISPTAWAFSLPRTPEARNDTDEAIRRRTRSGRRTASSSATAPPTLKPNTHAIEAQVVEHAEHVAGEGCTRERPVEVVGVPVPLTLHRDRPAAGRQPRQQRAELKFDVEQPAVQQQQRRRRAVRLAVLLHVQAQLTHLDVVGGVGIRHVSGEPDGGHHRQ